MTPGPRGCCVVFDEESESQDHSVLAGLAYWLSAGLGCPLLVVLNHDDSVLWYQLYLQGALQDEYDSCPDYFSSGPDDLSATTGPAGGDAQKLCAAFGTGNVNAVAAILQKSSGEAPGYVFETERHADLAAALGIPEFSVGVGYEHFAAGELPEGFNANDCLATKDFQPEPSAGPAAAVIPNPILPGYYKVRTEAPGANQPPRQTIAIGWMPQLWAEMDCGEGELSPSFYQATRHLRGEFKKLGFTEIGFKKTRNLLNPDSRDSGGVNLLDASRAYFGQIIYQRAYLPARDAEHESVPISFTAVFEHEVFSCTNNLFAPLGELAHHVVVRLATSDVAGLYRHFLEQVRQRTSAPRRFPDLTALQEWFDLTTVALFEDRARRGWFIPMSDFEVARARRQLPPPPGDR